MIELEKLLPHLADFIGAEITLSGDSGRSVKTPLDWPTALDGDSLPCFINQITGLTYLNQNNLYALYNVAVTVRLYYIPVGQDMGLKNQYDNYHYASQFLQAVINNNRLTVSSTDLPGIAKAAAINGTQIPATLPYPPDDAQGLRYIGAVFNLLIPIQVMKC